MESEQERQRQGKLRRFEKCVPLCMGALWRGFCERGSIETRVWSRELGSHIAFWLSEARKPLLISRLNVAARCCRVHVSMSWIFKFLSQHSRGLMNEEAPHSLYPSFDL